VADDIGGNDTMTSDARQTFRGQCSNDIVAATPPVVFQDGCLGCLSNDVGHRLTPRI
jgi:hypothetical protein